MVHEVDESVIGREFIDMQDENDGMNTALHNAVQRGKHFVCCSRILYTHYFKSRNANDYRPFSCIGMLETAYALIRLGARTDICNADGSTAVECSSNDDVNRAVFRYNNYWRR